MFGNGEELGALNNWAKEHDKICTVKETGAIGGKFTYFFTPTSLGVICKVECTCGEKYDGTKYECW
jgi:hypothetical protein